MVTEDPDRKRRCKPLLVRPAAHSPAGATAETVIGEMAIEKPRRKTRAALGRAAIALILAVAGCGGTTLNPSSNSEPNEVAQPSFADFSDLPIPASARMNLDRSLILGPKDAWLGRLVFRSSYSAAEAYDFYANGMARSGWQTVATVRGATSVMTYTRGERVATVQISGTTLGGSEIEITVAPSANGTGSYTGPVGSSPAPRGGGVQSAPLAR